MSTETVHYHYGPASYRIQYEVTAVADTGPGAHAPAPRFRVSLLRIKMLAAGSPLKYFSYTQDFDSLADARLSTAEYAKSLVRRQDGKKVKRQKDANQ